MKGLWDYLYNKDKRLFEYINKRIKCKLLDIFMPRITHLGGASFTVLSCLFLYIFGKDQAKTAAMQAFVTITGSQGIVQLFKNTIARKRPYLVLPDVNTFWSKLLKDHSFPSGHTTAGFSLAAVLAMHFPAYSLISYSLAAMVGLSRIYTGMHYPSDVLSGAFLGMACATLIEFFL
ncbi:phosphatase PAP2 family protein [Tepidanaerobacter sp. GT38]|uniref:phosphatase PAP2 family protein n=1 Tax=Tepidanaerobacter sp. GT38 TaxID=2722793 RepID=UPI001F2E4E49|nr:phosphatase PAP2 family protein [Tepidanaerobacter sp. GT38]